MTSIEAAHQLGYTVQHVRRLIRQGSLEGQKLGRDWVVDERSVERMLARRANLTLPFERSANGIE
ncbi:MAG: helix-turn-helix domain-containing protein [Longimicrobiales bacterium]|nr:helix-turn-helix domain-containing protein [Longimicrobiales bacterium]